MSLLPWLLLFTAWLFWTIQSKIASRKFIKEIHKQELLDLQNKTKGKIRTTQFIIMFLIYPNILAVMFTMFNCYEMDGVNYLVEYMIVQCYKGTHLYLVLFLVIPTIIIFGLGTPFSTFYILYKKRNILEHEKVQKELGFLFNGYRRKTYYWEAYIMIRKVIIVFVLTYLSTKGKTYQLLVIFLILSICLAIQGAWKPFIEPNLNRIEVFSILASFITIYAGYYFVVGDESDKYSEGSRQQFEALQVYNTIFLV